MKNIRRAVILDLRIKKLNCELCEKKPLYKESYFYAPHVNIMDQDDHLSRHGNVEVGINYYCEEHIDKKESYVNEYYYVFVEKIK